MPGVDLSPLIRGEWDPDTVIERDGSRRKGVLFITDDEITAPLSFERSENDVRSWMEYDVYLKVVEVARHGTLSKAKQEALQKTVDELAVTALEVRFLS